MPDNSIDSVVTDPPYELGFMGKSWDKSGIAFSPAVWQEVLRVLKPGGHLLAFSGSRTYHRMAVAVEDAGFEIRDQIMWIYGSGFPKSKNIALSIDKGEGLSNRGRAIPTASLYQASDTEEKNKLTSNKVPPYEARTELSKSWVGWGTALKPAHEPIVVARKPLIGTVAENILAYGTGGLNIDGTRVGNGTDRASGGRWPANVIHDGLDQEWSRFFYCAKASKKDRNEGLDRNHHPTVKPTELMRYLCRLVTPPNGTVLDPFMGSGSTGKACVLEGFDFIGIDKTPEYVEIAQQRINAVLPND